MLEGLDIIVRQNSCKRVASIEWQDGVKCVELLRSFEDGIGGNGGQGGSHGRVWNPIRYVICRECTLFQADVA
jgi:hypothetical protein